MADFIAYLIALGFAAILFVIGLIAFHVTEKKRQIFLEQKEQELADIAISDLKHVPEFSAASRAELVTGSVVVANNYFLGICAWWRNLFGGEMQGYSRLCTDARRMAIVRVKEEARSLGATCICCLRYETVIIKSSQQNSRNEGGAIELLAYGTALIPHHTEDAA